MNDIEIRLILESLDFINQSLKRLADSLEILVQGAGYSSLKCNTNEEVEPPQKS